jgi:hypothetical protein
VETLAARVCQGKPSPKQKIDAVVSFLQTEFTYTIEGMQLPQGVEPLSYFLLNRTPAHCEFFASGAVVLLRLQGVPCRYVTGYVVTELEGEYGDYWLARNRNAHAWAEAYDERRQQWVLVEATPGMRVPRDEDALAESHDDLTDDDGRRSSDLSAKQAWLAQRWLSRGWQSLIRSKRLPLLLTGAVVSLLVMVHGLRWRGRTPRSISSRHLASMQRSLARLDRRLRKHDFVRQPSETLHQFAGRLRQASDNEDWLAHCADWYLAYAHLRYAGDTSQSFPRSR